MACVRDDGAQHPAAKDRITKPKENAVLGHHGSSRRRLTYANVVSTLALVVAVSGGTAFAASKLITGKQIAKGTITAANIKSHSLLSSNFKKGQIPAGPRGKTGSQGAAGTPGGAGAPGSAIAYGSLGINGNGNPEFTAGLSKGFTSASSPSVNIICIPYPAGVTTNIPLEISDNGNETDQWDQVSNGQCDGNGYEIANITADRALSSGGLSIAIP
jgi:hypothetical protein